ncbi:hypothetical protein [Shewanella chilikensis]|uniref:hypothetical protein n=1 Tax=Shewanella chilikensis TaxID=558541 RepID=UPI001F1F77DE|nr:hypothetical protein [Shewanella chilikensis]MCE9789978.1 hypothetical protein [Shewanella chilikensis]
MYSGIALYDTVRISSKTVCELGEYFFNNLGLPITGAGYYSILEHGDHLGDHEIIETSFSDLKAKVENGEATAFRIYSEQDGVQPWYASFGYMTSEFGGFHYIDIQYPKEIDNPDVVNEFIRVVSEEKSFSYGIKYFNDKVTQSFYYATGDNMVNVFCCENSSLFKRECHSRFKGKERYKGSMLRMVYPVNIININHLGITIGGTTLKEWILSTEKHGTLKSLSNNIWLWRVEYDELEKLNNHLGELGLLISWKPLAVKKGFKSLS